ncbi:hypothetical protein Ga0609869_000641 [Rhodovulum iodosum]|uniref:DUF6647 domain-containing protein n=1 Tax=Rhodovulum iodosum TaxID=68291 RepID=A0ABV3XSC1_9RHOB|nr:DUF6647 family protein [Rhodovulum robiginosum]RSK31426.1 hypothetical protein EJA01_14890 [Rhodovulum robiginosum]
MPHLSALTPLALLAALALSPAAAHVLGAEVPPADCPAPAAEPEVPGALVQELLVWIGRATGYDVAESLARPPEIDFCSKGEWVDYEDARVLVDDQLRAVYDWPRRRVLIVRPWHADAPRDVSVLLHELVHHVQLLNRDWECLQAPEWEAYKLQDRWLAERGIASGFDWLAIYFMSRCPRDIHP